LRYWPEHPCPPDRQVGGAIIAPGERQGLSLHDLDLRSAVGHYVRNAILFGVSGRWAMPAAVRRLMRERGGALPPNYGKIEQPPNPPLGITPQQVEIVNRHLAKRKWTLVRNEDGFYRPQPIAQA
jgi:hypothetical protein